MRPRGSVSSAAMLVAALVVAACGAGEGERVGGSRSSSPSPSRSAHPTSEPTTAASTPSPTPITLREARRHWHDALYSTAEDFSGGYDWGAWLDGEDEAFMRETGRFGFDPLRTAFERVISGAATGSDDAPDEITLRVRRRGDAMYMQMADWGPWDGCWLHVTDDVVPDSMGFELADTPALPVSVTVALNARITKVAVEPWFGDPYEEYTAQVSALEALQFLGVSGATLIADQEVLLRAKVPILVSVFGGRLKGAAARGADVLAALKRSRVRVAPVIRRYVAGVSASVEFLSTGWGEARVRLPASRYVLPEGATRNRTCPAKTPLS